MLVEKIPKYLGTYIPRTQDTSRALHIPCHVNALNMSVLFLFPQNNEIMAHSYRSFRKTKSDSALPITYLGTN